MYTITNFSTEKDVLKQLKENDVEIKLSFSGKEELKVTKNPLEGMEVKDFEGNNQNITIIE
jgi:hypothetical protein